MYFVCARLAGGRSATEAELVALCEQIRRVAGPEEGLEHVYAQRSDIGMDLVIFVIADAIEAAEGFAAAVLGRALAASGSVFRLAHCAVDLFIPAAEAQLGSDTDG